MKRIGLLVAIMFVTGQDATGFVMCGNGRLDRVTATKDKPYLIVAGRITEVNFPKTTTDIRVMAAPSYRVQFHVNAVIFGDANKQGLDLDLDGTPFDWPDQLAPLKKGTFCILILDPTKEGDVERLSFVSVVPAKGKKFEVARDGAEVRRILAREILDELHDEKTESRQRVLIQQVAPIISAKETAALAPFLDSKNPWLRRAALAGLLYATRDAKYLEMVREDIEQFVKITDSNSLVEGLTPGSAYAPIPLLFHHYFFLDLGWSQEDDKAAALYLPLFRMLAANSNLPEYYRWSHGIENLCRIGDRTDAATIYAYCADRRTKARQELLEKSYNRQRIIMGLSRILGLDLSNWVEIDFLRNETEQHQAVTDTLIKEGLIKPQEAHVHGDSGSLHKGK